MDFPYFAFKISEKKNAEFRCIEDVYKELEMLYDKNIGSDIEIGKSLYHQCLLFVDPKILADQGYQRRIKEYLYCDKFKTSLYPTMNETPCDIVDDFLIIAEEHTACKSNQAEENKDEKNA